jgi:Flp pilus assembly protein TadD
MDEFSNPELLRKLSEVGYLSCLKGNVAQGEIIMEGVHAMNEQSIPIKVGLAVARISASRYSEAVEILQNEVLSIEPDNMTAKCFLGIALTEMGNKTDARSYLGDVSEHGGEDEKKIAEVYMAV